MAKVGQRVQTLSREAVGGSLRQDILDALKRGLISLTDVEEVESAFAWAANKYFFPEEAAAPG